MKQAWDDLNGKRPKLKIRIEALEKELAEKQASAGVETYECMYHCGFEGSYEDVEKHEATCPKAPKSEPEPAVDVDESLFDDSSDESD